MISVSLISLISFIFSIVAIFLSLMIFNRVFEEEYKRPWLFIGISSIFLGLNQILIFLNSNFNIILYNDLITQIIIYTLGFLSVVILTYGLFLEVLILKYYKGKFVQMKLMPVQEGTLTGEIGLSVSQGKSYMFIDQNYSGILEEISKAVKKGFEGFFITEENPKEIREKFHILKSPIIWITQVEQINNQNYFKEYLDENSEYLNPLQINQLITYIDNFLSQSQNPFIFININLILQTNNHSIVFELVRYISNKINKYEGVLIIFFDSNLISNNELEELKSFLNKLEI